MKNKYNDNHLAEEFDLIVVTGGAQEQGGLHLGEIGTLTYAYTGANKPLYAEFACADGTKKEQALDLNDFRVLDVKNPNDLSVIVRYLKSLRKNA